MTATIINALPDTGRYTIDTVHDVYEIDVDRNTITRLPLNVDAAGGVADWEDFANIYADVYCQVGEVLTVTDWRPADLGIRTRHTQVVLGITAVTE